MASTTTERAAWARDPQYPEEVQPPDETPPEDVRKDDMHGLLWTAYVLAVMISIVGLCFALYIAVAEKTASIRRHAIGVAGVSILSMGVTALIVSVVLSASGDGRVAGDLTSLLSDHSVTATNVTCTHQSGNQYACFATIDGQQHSALVTDDGHAIYEQGIAAP
jgi:hypothetical protein